MKNKTINELLIALKKEFNSHPYSGLCAAISSTTYFLDERYMLEAYLKKHAPWNKYTWYYLLTFKDPMDDWMWEPRDTVSRNKWLDKHIKKTQ